MDKFKLIDKVHSSNEDMVSAIEVLENVENKYIIRIQDSKKEMFIDIPRRFAEPLSKILSKIDM